MIPGLPDFAQGLTAVALLLTLLTVIGFMIKRERTLADRAEMARVEALKEHAKDVLALNAEIRSMSKERYDKAETNLAAMQSGVAVVAEAQKLVRELLPLIDRLKRAAGE